MDQEFDTFVKLRQNSSKETNIRNWVTTACVNTQQFRITQPAKCPDSPRKHKLTEGSCLKTNPKWRPPEHNNTQANQAPQAVFEVSRRNFPVTWLDEIYFDQK